MARAGRRLSLPFAAALLLAAVVSACDEQPLAPIDWSPVTDTTTIYSLARPELNLLSAFDFHDRQRIRIEQPSQSSQWDIALDTRDGKLVVLPPEALGVASEARILMLAGSTFETVTEAPKDTTLYTAQPLPVVVNQLYVIKTGLRPNGVGGTCSYYAKMKPIAVDLAQGSMTFVNEANPICSDRALVPPDTV